MKVIGLHLGGKGKWVKGILSVVKGHTKSLTIAFAFIIEAAEQEELPETVLCAFQVHALHLEDCPHLPHCEEMP